MLGTLQGDRRQRSNGQVGQGKETGMSQKSGTQERVTGFVVGSDKGGKEWKVRVKQEGHPQDGKKLPVQSVCVGTVLKPGLDVEFSTGAFDCYAHDVEAMPQAEAERHQPRQTKTEPSEDVFTINLAICEVADRGIHAWFTGCESQQELEKELDSETERVVAFLHMDMDEIIEAEQYNGLAEGFAMFDAMTRLSGAREALEHFAKHLFQLGVKHGSKQNLD